MSVVIYDKHPTRFDLLIKTGDGLLWVGCVLNDAKAKDDIELLGCKRKILNIGLCDLVSRILGKVFFVRLNCVTQIE